MAALNSSDRSHNLYRELPARIANAFHSQENQHLKHQ
jgi:hypothetical protein